MNGIDFFRYLPLVSVALFSLVALFLIRRASGFSFAKQTVSMTILNLNDNRDILLFKLNFLVKGMLDLLFAVYLAQRFPRIQGMVPVVCFAIAAVLFCTLVYYVEGKYTFLHRLIVYTAGTFSAVGMFWLTFLLGNSAFIWFSAFAIFTPAIAAYVYLYLGKTNTYVQAACMSIWSVWFLVAIFGKGL